jgi:methionyl-tRNA formyltransferase
MSTAEALSIPEWWQKPRRIAVVVDNQSWVLPYVEKFIAAVNANGDNAVLYRAYKDMPEVDVAFFLGCIRVAPEEILNRSKRILVCHASDLPKGRGFSPSSWAIIEGSNDITVCLLEAVKAVDAGPVVYREQMHLAGHELADEVRNIFGTMTMSLCTRFLNEMTPPPGEKQTGEPTFYPRRGPLDNRLDINKPLLEQFNLLRIVDNNLYPAYFEHLGHRYKLSIEKMTS